MVGAEFATEVREDNGDAQPRRPERPEPTTKRKNEKDQKR